MVIWAGIIIMAIMKLKNAFFNFHSYTTSAYAVSVEKYVASRVAPTDTIREFIKPTAGLKLLPRRIFRLLLKYVEGINDTACCWICVVDLVEFTIIITKGIRLRIAKNTQRIKMIVFFTV